MFPRPDFCLLFLPSLSEKLFRLLGMSEIGVNGRASAEAWPAQGVCRQTPSSPNFQAVSLICRSPGSNVLPRVGWCCHYD